MYVFVLAYCGHKNVYRGHVESGSKGVMKQKTRKKALKNGIKLWVPKHVTKCNKLNWIWNFWKLSQMPEMEQ